MCTAFLPGVGMPLLPYKGCSNTDIVTMGTTRDGAACKLAALKMAAEKKFRDKHQLELMTF